MATPPKVPPVKAGPRKVASPVKPVAKAAPVPANVEAEHKAAPFMIEPETLSAFVDKSDSALPVTRKSPVARKEGTPTVPVVATQVDPVPVAEVNASQPPQPVVAENMVAAKELPAQLQAPNALEGHHIMNEAIENGRKFAEDAKVRLQSLVTDFNDKAKVAAEKSSRTAEELSDITKGNLEAIVESSKIAAKGFETLGQNAAEYGRTSFERTSATLKSFASVKSPTEFFQLQSELVTSAFDTLAAETARTSEAMLKLAGDIAQPISNRYAVVSDRLKTLAA